VTNSTGQLFSGTRRNCSILWWT